MDSKGPKPWNEEDEVQTIELDKASAGAAGTKSIPSQGGGNEDDPLDDERPQELD